MKNPKVRIRCEELTVRFELLDRARVPKGSNTLETKRGKLPSIVALDAINVVVHDGDRIGLLGKNGAGKSTFLRALAGVYPPYSGSLEIDGKVASLFDVGAGMDANASGYDNIPLLMATRDIPKRLLKEVIADVEKFSDLGDALFRPVRTYAAGMRLKIAFAIATNLAAETLLLDEVIGVGDSTFREKSQQRIDNLLKNAGTLVVASHANSFLRNYCNRGLVFDSGKIVFDGDIEDAIVFYETGNS